MRVLACDTTQAACSIAYRSAQGRVRETLVEMARGHAEALLPQLANCLQQWGLTPDKIDRLGVGIGPGSFTGVRVGVAAMRALRLAWSKPLVGVSSLHAMAQHVVRTHKPKTAFMVVLPADARHVYCQGFASDGTPVCAPCKADRRKIKHLIAQYKLKKTFGAHTANHLLPLTDIPPYPRAGDIARLACALSPCLTGVRPLYLHAYVPQRRLRAVQM